MSFLARVIFGKGSKVLAVCSCIPDVTKLIGANTGANANNNPRNEGELWTWWASDTVKLRNFVDESVFVGSTAIRDHHQDRIGCIVAPSFGVVQNFTTHSSQTRAQGCSTTTLRQSVDGGDNFSKGTLVLYRE